MKGRVQRTSFPLILKKHISISAPVQGRCQLSLQNQSGQLTNRKRQRPASPPEQEVPQIQVRGANHGVGYYCSSTSQLHSSELVVFFVNLRAQSSHGYRLGCWNVYFNYPFMCLLLIMFFCCNSSVLLFNYSGERKQQILREAGTSCIFCIFVRLMAQMFVDVLINWQIIWGQLPLFFIQTRSRKLKCSPSCVTECFCSFFEVKF